MPSKSYTLTAVRQEDTELYEVNVKGLEELIQWAPSIGVILMKRRWPEFTSIDIACASTNYTKWSRPRR